MPDPYFSELKYLGGASQDFLEVVVDGGTDVSDLVVTIYRSNGTIRSTNSLAGITPTTIAGKDVYVIDTTSSAAFSGLGLSQAASLSDSSGVYAFPSFSDNAGTVTATEGPASGMTSTDIGSAGSGSSLESDDGGASYSVQTSPTSGSIPCLTAGTMVLTDQGQVKIEMLSKGTMIRTRDGSYKPLLSYFSKNVSRSDLTLHPKLRPIRICSGALGNGLPQRDLLVSRQHRMLVSSPIVKRMFDVAEVLVAAIKLIGIPGVYEDESITSVEYFHLLLEDHEVIFAEGAPTESFMLGAQALKSIPEDMYKELAAIFPDVIQVWPNSRSRHVIPSPKRQSNLVARHIANTRGLLSSF